MSATQDAKNWFVLLKGKRYGPYTFAALAHAAEKGVVDRDAGVWCLGWAEWRMARNVPWLFEPERESEPDEVEEDTDEAEEDADDHGDTDHAEADDRDEERHDDAGRDETADRNKRPDRNERSDRGEMGDRGKLAAARLTPDIFAAGKPLVALGRLSEPAADLRVHNPDADESAAKPDEASSVDLSAGPRLTEPAPPVEPEPAGRAGGVRLAVLSVLSVLAILFGTTWAAISLGLMRIEFMPAQTAAKVPDRAFPAPAPGSAAAPQTNAATATAPVAARSSIDGVPNIVADMPAVAALKTADPDAYAKFLKRFAAAYKANAADDEILTRARTALRKSMKHLLAKASTESLLEITEVNLAYMRALQPNSPGSCVALSDESKGATLDSNLARDHAPLFQREMAVLERIINSTASSDASPSEAEVRPYLEAVFTELKKQPVQTQLLGRDKLTAAEYTPYCDLVIAFYEAVRALPFADAVKLLRNLYATAAADPDPDKP
jgi:hypothetical protein